MSEETEESKRIARKAMHIKEIADALPEFEFIPVSREAQLAIRSEPKTAKVLPSLLQLQYNPLLFLDLSESEFNRKWQDLVNLDESVSKMEKMFLEEYMRRAKERAK